MNCQKCGTELKGGAGFCSNCGDSFECKEKPKLGMRWYKFTAYFELPFYAILDAALGIAFVSGILYELLFEYDIYGTFNFLRIPSIKVLNFVYGIVLILFALYHAYISYSLIKFKKNVPKNYYIGLIACLVIGLIYFFSILILMRDMIEFDMEIIASTIKTLVSRIGSTVFWLLIYIKYFNNRKRLFAN